MKTSKLLIGNTRSLIILNFKRIKEMNNPANEHPIDLMASMFMYKKNAKKKENNFLQLMQKRCSSIPVWFLDWEVCKQAPIEVQSKGMLFNSKLDISKKFPISQPTKIQGKMKNVFIRLASVKNDYVDSYGSFAIYSKFNYLIPLTYHENKNIAIPHFDKKLMAKPDYEAYNEYKKNNNFKNLGMTRINIKEFFNMLKDKLTVCMYGKRSVSYLDVKEALKDYRNQRLMLEAVKAYNANTIKFVYDGDLYFIDLEEIKENMSSIYLFVTSNESIEFQRMLNRAKQVKKVSNKQYMSTLYNKYEFNATLKPFQEVGASWMYGLYLNKVNGCILGDEMGLGKTIQTIATLTLINKDVTIICDASLVGNWVSEIKKFSPKLLNKCKIYSYESTLRKEITSHVVVYDEAQKMKNANTLVASRGRLTNPQFKILLTGTPIENSIKDIHSLIRIIMRESAKSLMYLRAKFRTDAVKLTREIIDAIYIARPMDKNVLDKNLIIKNEMFELSNFEKQVHDNIKRIYGAKLKESEDLNNNTMFYNYAIVGQLRLRQLSSNHTSLPKELYPEGVPYNSRISKLEKLKEMVSAIRAKKEKVIIFIQFNSMVEIIQRALGKSKCYVINQEVSKTDRTELVRKFQEEDEADVFIISLKAGARGLTLTKANHVIMYDLWWNPQLEAQAFARAFRIGQTKDVYATRLVGSGSVDEDVIRILSLKEEIIKEFKNFDSNDTKEKVNNKEIIKEIFDI